MIIVRVRVRVRVGVRVGVRVRVRKGVWGIKGNWEPYSS